MFDLSDLADSGPAFDEHLSDFPRRKLDQCISSLLCHQLSICASATDELASFADLELHIVNQCAKRDLTQWEGVAILDINVLSRDHHVPLFEPQRGQDVTFFPIGVMKEGYVGRTIGIILQMSHPCWDVVFEAFEVDDPVSPLVSPTPLPGCDAAITVPTTRFLQRPEERLFRVAPRDLLETQNGLESPSR